MYDNPYETWNRGGLSKNKDITIDLIHNLSLPHTTGDWDWFYISENISISEVYKYPDETWNRGGLSWNENLTIDLIHNLVLPRATNIWNWYPISKYIRVSGYVSDL